MAIPFGKASFPEIYEKALVGPLFRPWAERILEEVALSPGKRVLDVACGTGIVARLAKERVGATGEVVGVDLSEPMIAIARSIAPQVQWRRGDAASLPLEPGEQFDAVVCQQGLQFFADRPAAVRDMRRALRSGGRLALSTWRADEALPVLFELRRIAERHLGPIADSRHCFGEAGPIEALLRDAGFRDVRTKAVALTVRFREGALFVRLNALALLGMSGAGAKAPDEKREQLLEAIGRDSAELVRKHTGRDGFDFEIAATIATASA